MPTLHDFRASLDVADEAVITAAEPQINGSEKKTTTKRSATDLDESTMSKAMMPKKKKARRSILEQLNYGGKDDGDDTSGTEESNDDSPAREKENYNLNAKKKAATKKIKKGSSAKATTDKKAQKRTIRDFYSLSPNVGTNLTPLGNRTDASTTTPKRGTGKFVALNEDAKPIEIHVPYVGQDKYVSMTIEHHCVHSNYKVNEEPVVLSGKYYPRMKVPIERFLEGFGRYIH